MHYIFENISIEIIAVFVVSLFRISVVRMLQCLLDPRPEDGESYKFMSVRTSVR